MLSLGVSYSSMGMVLLSLSAILSPVVSTSVTPEMAEPTVCCSLSAGDLHQINPKQINLIPLSL